MTEHVDCIIVGGGVSGSTLALALGRLAGLRVALIDRGSRAQMPGPVSSRVSALGPGTRRVLEHIGAWERLPAERVSPYEHMFVWDAGSSGELEFDAAELGEPCLGYIIENEVLLHALHEGVDEETGITVRMSDTPGDLRVEGDGVRISLESGEQLSASLVVGADGGRSWVREQAGIDLSTRAYGQSGIVCRIGTVEPHRDTAWQRFLATGPVAILPMADGNSSIVWSADEARATELLSLDDEAFAVELAMALEDRLGAVTVLDQRLSFPLASAAAERYTAHRIALIGDAAHRVHPLAGQGANLGIKDVAALAEVLAELTAASGDIGGQRGLRRYERWRKTENLAVDRLMSSLKQVFGAGSLLPGIVRGPGMGMLNRSTSIKNLMARHAMGIAGDLPRMMTSPVETNQSQLSSSQSASSAG